MTTELYHITDILQTLNDWQTLTTELYHITDILQTLNDWQTLTTELYHITDILQTLNDWQTLTTELSWNHGAPPILFIITKTRLFKYIENFTSKNWKFWDKKKSDIFQISAQYIDCGHSLEPPQRGGSNEYPQSMFLSRNKKNNMYPYKPQFNI